HDPADEQAEADLLRARRDGGEHGVPVEHVQRAVAHRWDLVEVVHDGDRAEAGALGRPRDVGDRVEQTIRLDAGGVELRQVQSERAGGAHPAHATPHSPSRRPGSATNSATTATAPATAARTRSVPAPRAA